jgi:hypothetical protein
MAPIFLLSTSETLILQSVVRVVPFRKRPSETHSGPGLETPTDAVTVAVFSIKFALVQSGAQVSEGILLLQVLFMLPCTKDLA